MGFSSSNFSMPQRVHGSLPQPSPTLLTQHHELTAEVLGQAGAQRDPQVVFYASLVAPNISWWPPNMS